MSTNPHSASCVGDCRIIELDRFGDIDGTLSVVGNGPASPIPFDVRRVYYLYDLPSQASRGGHSHHNLSQLIVAASGSFDITLSDGKSSRTFSLNRPYCGLYITPGIWRVIDNFSSGAVCMVLASHNYDESDYVRSFDEFLALTADKR